MAIQELVVTRNAKYPIRPRHINADFHLSIFLGNGPTFPDERSSIESTAGIIVKLCQEKNKDEWLPFNEGEFIDLCKRLRCDVNGERRNFSYLCEKERAGLIEIKWLADGVKEYEVTHDFVARCFRASPHFSLFRA